MPAIDLHTLGIVRELGSGDTIVLFAAEPGLASFGDEDDALLEARMFLADHLARAEPEVVARFALPPGTLLHSASVVVPRTDLSRRVRVDLPIRLGCLVIPTIPNAKGLRDRWVMVLPLGHTFFATSTEDLDLAIAAEVTRIALARELGPLDYLDLLPSPRERIVSLEVSITRGDADDIRRGDDLKRKLGEREARREAIEILETVAEPLHAGLGTGRDPAPFPLRERELGFLRAMLASGEHRASVLLVGKERVGKSGLFRAWLEREHEVNRPRFVFATSGARLVAGMSGFGQWQERVRRVMEAARLLDAVLYFDDLTDLFADRPGGHVDIPSAMRPYLEDGLVRVVGEVREELFDRVEAQNGGFFACFGRVRLEPFDAASTRKVLDVVSAAGAARAPDRPVLSPEARAALVELAERYLPYESFPGKAIRLAEEIEGAHELALGSAARGTVIGPDVVHRTFSVRTGVPVFLLRDGEKLDPRAVAERLRARLVGQDEAVRLVAELVCVVKAGLQPAGKPLATMLFVGPTGVGKTELARALATLLFGSEERLVRFDMSEYASAAASERLFLGEGGAEGLLTRRIREQPFAIVLLDEIEKAHPAVFDVLLQVCGEGRLTDGRGKTAYFHNAIILLTSNLGASHADARAGFGARGDARPAEEAVARYHKVIRETFRPELVNRIDRIVPFRSLDRDDLRAVARVAIAGVTGRRGIVERGLEVVVSEAATAKLAEGGYSEAYGARALRRTAERALATPLAEVLSGKGTQTGERLVVSTAEEAAKEETEDVGDGTLRIGVVRGTARRSRQAAYVLDAITTARRITHRQLLLDRITALRDHVGYLVAQLSYGSGKKKKRDADALDGEQIARIVGEHGRLAQLTDTLEARFTDLCTIEELALVGFLGGEPIASQKAEADEAVAAFRRALVRALVAREPRPNAATLLLSELDDGRALDLWLGPLLEESRRRDWTLALHIDGDREPATTTPRGRWGPALVPDAMGERLRAPDRTFRNVVLRATGDHVGIWLALEAGVHRFAGLRSGEPPLLYVHLVARRAELADAEWAPPSIDPPTPAAIPVLAKSPLVRDHDGANQRIALAGGRTRIEHPYPDYWTRIEEIALAHLLVFETDPTLDRDDQLRPKGDDTFAEIRAILRRGNKIEAIKRYRALMGCGLREAKDAVEEMTS